MGFVHTDYHIGRFEPVVGTVKSAAIAHGRGSLYLGADWLSGFANYISPKHIKLLRVRI